MSVTVVSIPILLLTEIVPAAIYAMSMIAKSHSQSEQGEQYLNFAECDFKKLAEKDFKTTIKDKDTLLKTLKEHGAYDIKEYNGNIDCSVQQFKLSFVKNENDEAYRLTISYDEEKNPQTLVDDLSNEYCQNAQEVSYNKIKERLKEHNLEINEEEIYDDNTIVLTVNLD